jgi:hypothetical protein
MRLKKIIAENDFFSLFKPTKVERINWCKGRAKYCHTCDTHNFGYLINNLDVFVVNQDLWHHLVLSDIIWYHQVLYRSIWYYLVSSGIIP